MLEAPQGHLRPERLKSWRGEKQITRQVPGTGTVRKSGSSGGLAGASGTSAAKSLVNRIVGGALLTGQPLHLTLPRALRAVG